MSKILFFVLVAITLSVHADKVSQVYVGDTVSFSCTYTRMYDNGKYTVPDNEKIIVRWYYAINNAEEATLFDTSDGDDCTSSLLVEHQGLYSIYATAERENFPATQSEHSNALDLKSFKNSPPNPPKLLTQFMATRKHPIGI